MVDQAKRMKMKLDFYTAERNKNPRRGCLESHMAVIRNAIKEGHKYVLILEDDAMFIRDLHKLPAPPEKWDMLYLGGTVNNIIAREAQEELMSQNKSMWIRMSCWTTHAYIVNLNNKELVKDILASENDMMEIDRWYLDKIHPRYRCYMAHPMVCIQRPGFSDIENRKVEYSFMEKSIFGLRKPPHEIKDGSYRLKMPEIPFDQLPPVSIITPTRNRDWIFSLPMFNFQRFYYPPDRLEWIIIDSSDTDDLKHILPKNDKRIKYLHVPEPVTVAHKRNLGCKLATTNIIVHMDDDDYYPPESIMARVKLLVGYKGVECVGCSRIAIYNLLENTSLLATDGQISMSEASMAYFKSFWEAQPFDPGCERGEYYSFLQGRMEKLMDLPYIFVICALHHGRNFTERGVWDGSTNPGKEYLYHKETGKAINFPDTWDDDGQLFMSNLRKYLLNTKWYVEKYGEKKEEVTDVTDVTEVTEEEKVVE